MNGGECMEAKIIDLQNRIAKGEKRLALLSASDPKRDGVEKNLSKLRRQLTDMKGSNPQTSGNSSPEAGWKYEPPFIEVDPRPDLDADSEQWSTLLKLALNRNEELCGVLNGIRCGGTRLRIGQSSKGKRWILKPDIDPTGRNAWENLADYEEVRDKFLMPHLADVTALLKDLAERHEPTEQEIQQEMRF